MDENARGVGGEDVRDDADEGTPDDVGGEGVVIVGAGVAGLSAAIFTARAGLPTRVVSVGEPILERNAHLENYPGFPAGIDPRLFLEMTTEQAERAGATFVSGRVTSVERAESAADDAGGFRVVLDDDDALTARYVVAASWSDSSYLASLDLSFVDRGSKQFVGTDEGGRTGVDGLYAAGRLAEQYHQTVVSAGHGAQAALSLLEDADRPFYHDWVAPAGYFTGRGRDVPPGCKEIDADERRRRESESRSALRSHLHEPHDGEPTMHPVVDGE